jgi:hypothetical protein
VEFEGGAEFFQNVDFVDAVDIDPGDGGGLLVSKTVLDILQGFFLPPLGTVVQEGYYRPLDFFLPEVNQGPGGQTALVGPFPDKTFVHEGSFLAFVIEGKLFRAVKTPSSLINILPDFVRSEIARDLHDVMGSIRFCSGPLERAPGAAKMWKREEKALD